MTAKSTAAPSTPASAAAAAPAAATNSDAPAASESETGEELQGPFQLGDVRALAQVMKDFELGELELTRPSGERLRLKSRRAEISAIGPVQRAPAAVPAPLPIEQSGAATAAARPSGAAKEPGVAVIAAPLVGTFYRSPGPDSPAFVEVGQRVGLLVADRCGRAWHGEQPPLLGQGAALGQEAARIVPARTQALEPVGEGGGCVMLRRNNPFCDPPCQPGTTCDFDGACIPYPSNHDVGLVDITGLVEPVDSMAGEPWDADVLDWLASDFVANGHDLKQLIAGDMTEIGEKGVNLVHGLPLKRAVEAMERGLRPRSRS